MKKQLFLIGFIFVLIAEIVTLIVFSVQTPEPSQDTVVVNEVLKSVTEDFHSIKDHENKTELDYVVLDSDGNLLYKTKAGLSESVNAAVSHRDTILDIAIDGSVVGKVVIYNDGAETLQSEKQTAITVLSVAIALECLLGIGYAVYLHYSLIRPFHKLKDFAERVAGGNLDIPLEMDRRNLFGAFTESFDIMRSELKKARLAQAHAEKEKKELVAKLSHDIKTPIASIKAVAEVGQTVAEHKKDKENYSSIVGKADEINALVTNLFTATLEELNKLTVSPVPIESGKVKELLENADYLHRAAVPELSQCLVTADALRLQQVFDNIFANSYKYAKTDILVKEELTERFLTIEIEDYGGGVEKEELPVLKEKFKRGSNAANSEGAGLGLFISDYFMKEMGGELRIKNGAHGLKATVLLPLC